MSGQGLLIALIIGAIAGWLAGQIVRGFGFGLIGNIVVGILGALLASFLLPALGISIPGGVWVAGILSALIGAIVLLLIIGLFRRGSARV